jgi:hypothetical protein
VLKSPNCQNETELASQISMETSDVKVVKRPALFDDAG